MLNHNKKIGIKNITNGFTLVEILVIVPIVILVIGAFITAIVSMTGDVLATRAGADLAYKVQDALSRIEQDVKISGGFLSANNFTISSPQGFNDDANIFKNATGTNGNALILNTYATTANPSSPNRNIAYTKAPNTCGSANENQNLPVIINVVYFVKNNTLWRRILAKSTYATDGCNSIWQKPSCATGISGAICANTDEKLVEGIDTSNGFVLNYYPTPASETENTVARGGASESDATRQTALQSNGTVKVTINATTSVAGRDVKYSGFIRATSINNYILSY